MIYLSVDFGNAGNIDIIKKFRDDIFIEEKIDIKIIKNIFNEYKILGGIHNLNLKLRKTIIKIYNNRNEKF